MKFSGNRSLKVRCDFIFILFIRHFPSAILSNFLFLHGESPKALLEMISMGSKLTQEVRNAVYELVFVLSQGNALMSYLGAVNTVIDYVQLVALSLSKVDYIDWKATEFQKGIIYTVLPWPADDMMFFITFGATLALNTLLLVLFYQAYAQQGIQSVAILQTGRVGMSLFSTILYFPIIDTFLQNFKNLLALGSEGQKIFGTEVDYDGRLALCWVAVLLFSIPVYLFTFLCFSPDPLSHKSDLTAKVNTRPEILDLLCRGLMALNFTFNESAVARVWVQLMLVCILLLLHLVYPTFATRWMNNVRVAQFGSLLWICATAVYIQANPVEDDTIFIATLALLPLFWIAFGYVAKVRMAYLDIGYWLLLQNFEYRQPTYNKNELWEQKLRAHVTCFVNQRCRFPIDVEIASRHCLDSKHSDVGRLLFELGLLKFPKSVFLNCRFAIYLVFIDKPTSHLISTAIQLQSEGVLPTIDDLGGSKARLDGINENESPIHVSPNSNREYSEDSRVKGIKLANTSHHAIIACQGGAWNENKRQSRIEKLLKKTFLKSPALDLRYIFFYLVVELEQHFCAQEAGEQELKLLDSIRFKHESQLARYHHQEALKAKFQFWSSVLAAEEHQPQQALGEGINQKKSDGRGNHEGLGTEDLEQQYVGVSCVISDRFYHHYKAAQMYYRSLLTKFPCSRTINYLYADFHRQVAQDERFAIEIERHYVTAKQIKRNGSDDLETGTLNSTEGGSRRKRLYGALLSTIGGSSKATRKLKNTVRFLTLLILN
jgi:hypothetical protein